MPPKDTAEASVSLHANTITLDDTASKTIKFITYLNGSLQISSGQPSKTPPSITVKNNVWEITLQAGRHKTSAVANSFNTLCGGKAKEYAPSGGGGGTPNELNFFFGIVITFQNGASQPIYLAQGSYGTTNNWWIGGSPIFSQDKPRLEYQGGSNIYANKLSGDHKTFKLQQTDVRPVSPIQNVFVLMLENHSFDNLLALSGIPGIYAATPACCNSYTDKDGNEKTCCFAPNAPSSMPTDPGHEFGDVLYQLTQTNLPLPKNSYPPINNGGFAENYATSNSEKTGLPKGDEVCDIMRGFKTAQQLYALYQLASTYAVCDQWFSSLPGPTWPNRFFLHGASSNGLDHSPTSLEMAEWETIDGFRYPNGSIFDRMNQNGITWRLYHDKNGPLEGAVSQVSSIHKIELWDVHPLTDFVKDIQSASYPYQYTFIEPNYGDVAGGTYENGTSQHPMDGVAGGEGLIATIYKAIRNSPIWKQSLLIITYDEHGGFYDSYRPGTVVAPGDGGVKYNKYGFNFAQYGVRVPAVVVSPYIKAGVDHTVYDHSSVLATLEYLFGLAPLTERDKQANNLVHLFSDMMRDDTPTELKVSADVPPSRAPLSAEEKATLDLQPVPEASTLVGMLGVLLKADSKISGSAAAQARFAAVKTRGEARAYMREVMAKVEAARATRQKEDGGTPTPS